MAARQISFSHGDAKWQELRDRYTKSIRGKYSSLYTLNAELLQKKDVVPMTYRAHWAMCLFAEGMTGIPEIDSARVKMILVPRGLGKSTLITCGMTIHDLLRYDDYSVGIANETQDGANDFVEMVKMEFEQNELLRALFPERVPDNFRETTWKTDEIVIKRKRPRPKSASVVAAGVGATKTGIHVDKWVLDDILSQNAAENAASGAFTEIQATNRWVKRLQPMLCSPKRDPIFIIGTRWWEGDTYEWLEGTEEEPGLFGHGEKKQEFRWQLTLPDGERQSITVYRRGEMAVFCRPAIDEKGQSIFPERYTIEELGVMEAEDPIFFAGQYLLAPAGGKAREFQEEWLGSFAIEGKQVRFVHEGRITYVPFDEMTFLMSVDPAFSKKNPHSARTAMPVTAVWRDKVFLFEDHAERGMGNHDIGQKAVDFCFRYPIRKMFVESINAQAAVAEEINRALEKSGLPNVLVQEIPRQTQAKAVRIYGMENIFRQRRFLIQPFRHTKFLQEYNGFPRNAMRDILDALAFQRREWEKLIQFGAAPSQVQANDHVQQDLARLRNAFARR